MKTTKNKKEENEEKTKQNRTKQKQPNIEPYYVFS